MAKLNETSLWSDGPPFPPNCADAYQSFWQDGRSLCYRKLSVTTCSSVVRVAAWVRRAVTRFKEKACRSDWATMGGLSAPELTHLC